MHMLRRSFLSPSTDACVNGSCAPRSVAVQALPMTALPVQELVDALFREPFFAPATTRGDSAALPINMVETDAALIVIAHVPGFAKQDISVQIHDDVLAIEAHKRDDAPSASDPEPTAATDEAAAQTPREPKAAPVRYLRREIRQRSLARHVQLPVSVRDDAGSAQLKDGVLTLTLPKHEKIMPRKMTIN